MPANLYEPGDLYVKGSAEAEGGFTSGGVPIVGAPIPVYGYFFSDALALTTDWQDYPNWTAGPASGISLDLLSTPQAIVIDAPGTYFVGLSQFGDSASVTATEISAIFNSVGGGGLTVTASPDAPGTWLNYWSELITFAAGDRLTATGKVSAGTGTGNAVADVRLFRLAP